MKYLKATLAVLASAGLMSSVSIYAAAATYNGVSGGSFADTNNWDIGYPGTADYAVLNGWAVLSDTAPNNTRALRMGGTSVLDVNAGGSASFTTSSNWDSAIGRGGTGTVNVNGGFLTLNFVEVGRDSSDLGTINLNSGTFQIVRGSRENNDSWSIHLGGNDNDAAAGSGVMNIYGGSLITRAGIELGNQDAAVAGTGIFNVFGSDATINIGDDGSSVDGNWYQGSGSTLSVGVDAGGLSTIMIYEDGLTNGFADVTFDAGSLLDVGYYDDGSGIGTWTVMELEDGDIVDNGLAFAAGVDTDVWSFNIDNSGANGILTVTAIPEPATIGMFALFGGAMLFIRRRSRN